MSENTLIPADMFNVARLDAAQLPDSYDAALEILQAAGIQVDSAADVLADEYPETDKAKLVNVPFLLLTWMISRDAGAGNAQYIIARGITELGKRFRFSDGSTGVKDQLIKLTGERRVAGVTAINAGLYVPGGLRVSEYDYTNPATGETGKAKTYYLSNASE